MNVANTFAIAMAIVINAVVANPSQTKAGTAGDGMFLTDVAKLSPQWAEVYGAWLKRIDLFTDRAFLSCIKLKRDSGKVPDAKVAVAVALDVDHCRTSSRLFDLAEKPSRHSGRATSRYVYESLPSLQKADVY